jgi:formamidopyrimidine-DNA glycosylase
VPELPEVETVVRLIRPRLEGRRIAAADVRWQRTLGGSTAIRFTRAVRGARIRRVWRRGKFIVMDLAREGRPAGWLLGHLRMTGRFHVASRSWDPGPYCRLSLELDDKKTLHFVDPRKFGRIWFTQDLDDLLGPLGPEPLGDEFTPGWLHAALSTRRRLLKPLLLDQTFVAGLGNIYSDESLHASRLHPLRRSDRVSTEEAARLHASIRSTLREAILREGSSFDGFYRTPDDEPGSYQDELRVYGRAGEPCPACGEPIRRIVVAQRGTHLCRRCQGRPSPRRGAATLSAR